MDKIAKNNVASSSQTGNVTNGSAVITGLTTTSLVVNQEIVAPGFVLGTVIKSVDSGVQVTASQIYTGINSTESIDFDGLAIRDTGIVIPASGQYVLNPTEYDLWEDSSDVEVEINAGNVTINDGVTDLSSARGIDFIRNSSTAFGGRFLSEPERSNGLVSKNLQEAIEEAFDDHHDELHILNSHTDVNIISPINNEVLAYNIGNDKWINQTPEEAGISPFAHTHAHSDTTGQGVDDHHNEDHQARHNEGGDDALKLDDLAATNDNTDLDSTTSEHGLLLKLGGGTTDFLRADGTWQEPPGTGGGPDDDTQSVEEGINGQSFSSESWQPITSFQLTTSFSGGGTKDYIIHLSLQAGPTAANGEGQTRLLVDGVVIEVTKLTFEGLSTNNKASYHCHTNQSIATGKVIKVEVYALNGKQFTVRNRTLSIRGM